MNNFETKQLPVERDYVAPDGSDVRVLPGLEGGGFAHFEIAPGKTSVAIAHRTVSEIWYFISGRGEMWRKLKDKENVVSVEPGVCITIPVGRHFQFRSLGSEWLSASGVTMPPRPGEGEAYQVTGKWDCYCLVLSESQLKSQKYWMSDANNKISPNGLLAFASLVHDIV